jgi:hypothetical protein
VPPVFGAGTHAPQPPPAATGRRRGKRWVTWLIIIMTAAVAGFCALAFLAFNSLFRQAWAPILGTSQPVVESAAGAGPWTLQGGGYKFVFDSPVRSSSNTGCSSDPSLTIRGTETRTTTNEFTSLSYDVRNQDNFVLTDAGSDTWSGSSTLGQTYPVILNVCEGKTPVASLTITITDFYNRDGALILKNIPVPAR